MAGVTRLHRARHPFDRAGMLADRRCAVKYEQRQRLAGRSAVVRRPPGARERARRPAAAYGGGQQHVTSTPSNRWLAGVVNGQPPLPG